LVFESALKKLSMIQSLIRGFRHNDFKGDNILCTSSCEAVIIDFECSTSACGLIRCPLIDQNDPICEEYGLSSSACSVYDLHTLIADTLGVCGANVRRKISEFIETSKLDATMFHEVTKKGRLSLQYQTGYTEKEKNVLDVIEHRD
jgi:hypothetical protein